MYILLEKKIPVQVYVGGHKHIVLNYFILSLQPGTKWSAAQGLGTTTVQYPPHQGGIGGPQNWPLNATLLLVLYYSVCLSTLS